MTPPTYAKTGGPPQSWRRLRIIDLETQREVRGVIEIDTAAGWLRRYQTDERGRLVINAAREATVERLAGRFRIERK
jgi:hypothetical protein